MAEGSRRRLIYVTESAWGTTPATPTMLTLRNTGGSGLKLERGSFKSAEMRSDRQIPFLRLGNKIGRLEVPFELSDASFEDMFASAMFSAWDAAAITTTLTGVSCAVAASDDSYTRASGSWTDDGFAVGDRVRVSSFVEADNNITGVITTLTATKMTMLGQALHDETLATGGVFLRRKQIQVGTTAKSFSIEEGFLDMTTPGYKMGTGFIVDKASLSIAPEKMVTGSFSLVGKDVAAMADATGATAVTAAGTSEAMDSFSGSIKEANASIAIVTSVDFAISNGLDPKPIVGASTASRIGSGRSDVTGSISFYLSTKDLPNKFTAETASSLELECADSTGKKMTFFFPSIKFTGADEAISENDVSFTMPFQALYHAASLSNLIIEVA